MHSVLLNQGAQSPGGELSLLQKFPRPSLVWGSPGFSAGQLGAPVLRLLIIIWTCGLPFPIGSEGKEATPSLTCLLPSSFTQSRQADGPFPLQGNRYGWGGTDGAHRSRLWGGWGPQASLWFLTSVAGGHIGPLSKTHLSTNGPVQRCFQDVQDSDSKLSF